MFNSAFAGQGGIFQVIHFLSGWLDRKFQLRLPRRDVRGSAVYVHPRPRHPGLSGGETRAHWPHAVERERRGGSVPSSALVAKDEEVEWVEVSVQPGVM